MRGFKIILLCFLLTGCVSAVRVHRGDTLYSIAKKHDIPVRALIQENKIDPPYIIKVGQRLKIPKQKTYTVRRRDTLYSIARRFDLPVSQVARQNKLQAPYTLKPGQEILIQSWEDDVAVNHKNQSDSTLKTAPLRQKVQVPASAKNKRFNRPVSGKIIQKFGALPNGTYNDGVNISAKAGTPILAADKGVVAYAGNDLKGYGNLVLIRHDNGWFTAYAHAQKINVKKGTVVQAKQQIATVGKTGGVSTPQLHFEVRYKTKPLNPESYLK